MIIKMGGTAMFKVGDLIVYSAHGICEIDDICEKTVLGVTRSYYVLHPIEDNKLSISTPVDNDAVVILDLIHKDEAEEIMESFKHPGANWIENANHRFQEFSEVVNTGNRKDISKIVNTLMRKKQESERNGKKISEQDRKLLTATQKILFKELAIALNTTIEAIFDKTNSLINKY